MTQRRQSPGAETGAPSEVIAATNSKCTQQADIYAWTGAFLADGRVVSIAWLRGYTGAVVGRRREVRRGRAA